MPNLVIVPTYNERENIPGLVRAITGLSVPFDILVIDDNSPDGTASLVREMMPAFPNLHLLERPGKMGLGRAYIAGIPKTWSGYGMHARTEEQTLPLAQGISQE
jgi:dolichol-phosphate mannosyltransferase